jgi:hypothetical protein
MLASHDLHSEFTSVFPVERMDGPPPNFVPITASRRGSNFMTIFWGFPEIGLPQNGWFIMENLSINGRFGGTPSLGNLIYEIAEGCESIPVNHAILFTSKSLNLKKRRANAKRSQKK